jgi:PAS domain S-box-containing protein
VWLNSLTAEEHTFLSEECTCLKLASTGDGKILWANREFREWSGYTHSELIKLGWMDLSVQDDGLAADVSEIRLIAAGEIQQYRVQKKYRKRNGDAVLGTLTVKRFPLVGEVKFYTCTWEPHVNGTAAAFTLAIEKSVALEKRIESMLQLVGPTRSKVRKLGDAFFDWAEENPKLATGLVVMVLSMAQTIQPIVTRFLPAQPVQIEVRDPKTGETHPASEQLINRIQNNNVHSIAHVALVKSFEVTTKGGHAFAWNTSGGRGECVPIAIGRIRRSGTTSGYGDRIATESGRIVGGMPGAEQF